MTRWLRRLCGIPRWSDLTTTERQMVAMLILANKLTRLS